MRSGDKSPASWLYLMSSLASTVAAASATQQSATVTSVFCAEMHLESPVAASVLKVDKEATEYAINCGTPARDGSYGYCGDVRNDTMILTVGPSTMAILGTGKTL